MTPIRSLEQPAGLIQGTVKPVAVMGRSASAASKYHCVALLCLMAGET